MSLKQTPTMLQFRLQPTQGGAGGNPGVERIVPHDISVYGFQIIQNQTDNLCLEPRFRLMVNQTTIIGHPDVVPQAPFIKPYFFSVPLEVRRGSRIRFETFLPTTLAGVPTTALPEMMVFYRDLDEKKSGQTRMFWTRVNNTTLQVPITFSSDKPVNVRSMFTFEDVITAPNVLGLISYPDLVNAPLVGAADTRNLWSIKREDLTNPATSGFFDNILDQGFLDLWRWGYFVRRMAGPPASLPKVDRYRFFNPLFLSTNKQLLMLRPWTWVPPAPAVAADSFTNFIFEFEELLPGSKGV